MSQLSVSEKIDLSHLEQAIEVGKVATLKMARSLWEIRERRLYREQYPAFEDYCQERWGISRQYCNNLISYYVNVAELETIVSTDLLPENEAQARPLRSLPTTEQKVQAIESAVAIAGGGRPNSAQIQRAAKAAKVALPEFTIGQTVTVLAEESPHYGKSATVADLDGLVVQVEVEGDRLPLLRNEVAGADRPSPPPEPKRIPTTKTPHYLGGLQAELDTERERVELLERSLAGLVGAIESRIPYDKLLDKALKAKELLE